MPALLAIGGAIWLVWAFPHLHAASRLGLQLDRDGYAAQALKIAESHGKNVRGWREYVKAETKAGNQQLRLAMPADPIARTFPPGEVLVTFLPRDESAAASVTLRPEGRAFAWKFAPEKGMAAAVGAAPADSALRELAGEDASRFRPTTAGVASRDGAEFAWEWMEGASQTPQVRIDSFVSAAKVTRAETKLTFPETFQKNLDQAPIVQLSAGAGWFVLLILGLVIPILREGAANAGRSMKDRSAIRLAALSTVLMIVGGFLEWDGQMIENANGSSGFGEILGIVISAMFVGLFMYALLAGSFLNARLHPGRIRGLRLLPSAAAFSRIVGREVLGGWLSAPALVGIPLAVSALWRVSAQHGYSDGVLLSRWPVLDAFFSQDIMVILALAGLMIPLGLRFARLRWLHGGTLAVAALLTFTMLTVPFPRAEPANLMAAGASGALILWVYLRFGVLGALTTHCTSKIISAAGALLVQPAHALHNAGSGILGALACIGIYAFLAAWRGPEISTQLYGETGSRVPPKTRREELLAEFHVARSAQQQMLPLKAPDLAGYTIAATCEPAREVGGDLYDFLRLRDGRLGIGVADVSGKGVPAALYMTLTKGLLCAAAQDSSSPHAILTSVNTHLRETARRKVFVTMALGVLDVRARTLEYVRAGHNPIIWRRAAAGETRMLSAGGMALGLTGPLLFAKTLVTESIDLEPGDALVFYSDGLTEAMNGSLEQFGDERLMEAVGRADGVPAQATMDSILREVKEFLRGGQSQDDLTLAVLRVSERAGLAAGTDRS